MAEQWPWQPQQLERFWWFVMERHNMFIRRVIQQFPPPWTEDPALAGGYYTNVYRELDRVTRDYLHEVAAKTGREPASKRVWNTLLYRMFNLPATYQALGGWQSPSAWNPQSVKQTLHCLEDAGARVFTGAYVITNGGQARSKIDVCVDYLTHANQVLPEVMASLREAQHDAYLSVSERMRAAHTALRQFQGVGAFVAYELLTDLLYAPSLFPDDWTENGWVSVGPGAVRGLHRLLIEPTKGTQHAWAVHELRVQQLPMRRRFGLVLRGPNLTLRGVEHSLCEYDKYARMRLDGDGMRIKRKYRPGAGNADLTPWADVSSIYHPGVQRKLVGT